MVKLDGKILSAKAALELKRKIAEMKDDLALVIIQVGDLSESNRYIKTKKAFGESLGVRVTHHKYPENVSDQEIMDQISKHNADPSIDGIMVQLPLPASLDTGRILEAIDPLKDVDCLTSQNIKLLFDNTPRFMPATTKGVLTLLKHHSIDLKGKKVVVVGDSPLVGRPTALAFLNEGATVTTCHIHTGNLERETRQADILVAAAGSPGLITSDHVHKDQVVVDIGFSVVEGKVVGDVNYEEVKDLVQAITPVPGGVGPMTVLSLFENLLESSLFRQK